MKKIEFTDYQLKIIIDLIEQEINHLTQIPFHFRAKISNLREVSKKLSENLS